MCDCVIDGFKTRCRNTYCENKICDNCAILCDCCDNKNCKSCLALCEIEGCTNSVCIPLIKRINSDTLTDEYKYKTPSSCYSGCGKKYICIEHRASNDDDILVCINCEEESEYICKCGCLDTKIYKNCEEKCQVRETCTNYIYSNHMLENNCDTCGRAHQYSCIDCFVDIGDNKYCVNCANA